MANWCELLHVYDYSLVPHLTTLNKH